MKILAQVARCCEKTFEKSRPTQGMLLGTRDLANALERAAYARSRRAEGSTKSKKAINRREIALDVRTWTREAKSLSEVGGFASRKREWR